MNADVAETEETDDRGLDQIRLVGYGIAFAGALTLVVAFVSTQPDDILVLGLAGLAVAVLVFEYVQGDPVGGSLGILTGSLAASLWPTIGGGESYYFLGGLLITTGIVNTLLFESFYRLGERLSER